MRTDKKKRIAGSRWRLAVTLTALISGAAVASEAGGDVIKSAHNDITNVASLQRGARNFVNYCMGCHSARYVRYSRLGTDLGLSEQQVIENVFELDKRTVESTMTTRERIVYFTLDDNEEDVRTRFPGSSHIWGQDAWAGLTEEDDGVELA